MQAHFATWLALRRDGCDDGDPVPGYVEREFRRYLECGILAHGFARARCGECGHDFLIAFSCKGSSALVGTTATFITSALAVGTHPITAVYSGDADDATSTSPIVNQVVNPTAARRRPASGRRSTRRWSDSR